MTSRVLVGPILIPSRRNVNDEARQEGKDQVQDGEDDPLADVKLGGRSELLGLVGFKGGVARFQSGKVVTVIIVTLLLG